MPLDLSDDMLEAGLDDVKPNLVEDPKAMPVGGVNVEEYFETPTYNLKS